MQHSPIQWTDFTSNPLRYRDQDGNVVHACIHASTGCLHCYSEQLAGRWGRSGKPFTVPSMEKLTPFLDEKELHQIRTYKPAAGKMVFLGDMTDVFGDWVSDDLLNELFSNCLELRTDVTFQILTKRADRMQKYLSWRYGDGRIPMRNIWFGVSVENQQCADERIPLLLKTPAAFRFVSYEPALAPVTFLEYFYRNLQPTGKFRGPQERRQLQFKHEGLLGLLHQIIVGGESGSEARPFWPDWAQTVIHQCKAAEVACFVKQMGSNAQVRNDQIADIWYYADGSDMDTEALDADSYRFQGAPVRLKLRHSHGGDPAEWPEAFRVREFPEVRA